MTDPRRAAAGALRSAGLYDTVKRLEELGQVFTRSGRERRRLLRAAGSAYLRRDRAAQGPRLRRRRQPRCPCCGIPTTRRASRCDRATTGVRGTSPCPIRTGWGCDDRRGRAVLVDRNPRAPDCVGRHALDHVPIIRGGDPGEQPFRVRELGVIDPCAGHDARRSHLGLRPPHSRRSTSRGTNGLCFQDSRCLFARSRSRSSRSSRRRHRRASMHLASSAVTGSAIALARRSHSRGRTNPRNGRRSASSS